MKRILLLISIVAVLCTSCEPAAVTTNSTQALAGNYVITSLLADVAVDLDANSVAGTDLLQEGTCIQQMNVSFDPNGTFTAVVVDVSFDTTNSVVCAPSTETGTYSYQNGLLTLTTNVNGGTVTETQAVVLTPTTFSFTLGASRVSQLFPDIATTPAAGITNLDFVYTRI